MLLPPLLGLVPPPSDAIDCAFAAFRSRAVRSLSKSGAPHPNSEPFALPPAFAVFPSFRGPFRGDFCGTYSVTLGLLRVVVTVAKSE